MMDNRSLGSEYLAKVVALSFFGNVLMFNIVFRVAAGEHDLLMAQLLIELFVIMALSFSSKAERRTRALIPLMAMVGAIFAFMVGYFIIKQACANHLPINRYVDPFALKRLWIFYLLARLALLTVFYFLPLVPWREKASQSQRA